VSTITESKTLGAAQESKPSGEDRLDRLLRLPEVLNLLSISRSTWYAGIKDGRYPKPIRISRRTARWHGSVIQNLQETSPRR